MLINQKSKPVVGLALVNYQTPKETLSCLQSLLSQTGKFQTIPIVVENGSSDQSKQILSQKIDKSTKVIFNQENVGFALACNQAITYLLSKRCDYILIINPDVTIEDDQFISNLLKSKLDITSPIIKYKLKNGQTIFDHGGKIDWLFARNKHLSQSSPPTSKDCPDYLSGVCLLFSAKALEKNGLFDQRFFLYYEDADFFIRARKNNLRFGYSLLTEISHTLSLSANKLGKKKLSILADSQFKFSLKNLSPLSFPFYLSYYLYLKIKSI